MKITDSMRKGELITINGQEIRYHKIYNDINGNPRIVVHFRDLGVELNDYGRIPNLTMYRAKWYGGGYVMQAWNVRDDLTWALKQVEQYYERKGK